jgi:hypothetical protein
MKIIVSVICGNDYLLTTVKAIARIIRAAIVTMSRLFLMFSVMIAKHRRA